MRGYPRPPGSRSALARRFRTPDLAVPDGAGGTEVELAALDAALGTVGDDIARQRTLVAGRADGDAAEIFDAHLLFLRDGALLFPTRRAIADDGVSAARAWHDVIERTAKDWDDLADEYLRARAADLRSVGSQVLARLLDVPIPHPELEAPGVVIASDLSPADTVGLDPAVVLGIATAGGGPTSHAAVLARASGIPAVVGAGDALLDLAEGTPIVVDGTTGVIHVDPDPSLLAELSQRATAGGRLPARHRTPPSSRLARSTERRSRSRRTSARRPTRSGPSRPAPTGSASSERNSCSRADRRCRMLASRKRHTGRPPKRWADVLW